MAIALGKTSETELENDLHKVSLVIRGESGIMFTNESFETITKLFFFIN